MLRRTILAGLAAACLAAPATRAADLIPPAAELEADVDAALERLYSSNPGAKELAPDAKAILVFPEILKGGLLIGGAAGTGILRVGGESQGTYQSIAISYGLQAGFSSYGYIMMFLDDASLRFLDESAGWEVGVGPNVTIADEGFAKKLSTTTAQEGVVVFFINQSGYYAGTGIEGAKITKVRD